MTSSYLPASFDLIRCLRISFQEGRHIAFNHRLSISSRAVSPSRPPTPTGVHQNSWPATSTIGYPAWEMSFCALTVKMYEPS